MAYVVTIREGRYVVIGVADPPVYDNSTTYFAVMRPPDNRPLNVDYSNQRKLSIRGDADKAVVDAKELLSSGFVGVRYDIMAHEMTFAKLR